MDQAAFTALTRARIHLIVDQPFFGALAMRLELIEDNSIPTLCVDGKTVRYNAKHINEVKQRDFQLVKSELAHEVMHCVLNHCGKESRGMGRDPQKWNHAADYAVNSILKEAGFAMDDTWLYDAQYKDMSAEHIYRLIPDPPPNPDGGQQGPQDHVTPGTPDPVAQAQQQADWQLATAQAAQVAKQAGKLPKSLEHLIETMQQSKVDWQSELRNFVSRAAQGDYSWAHPNRMMQAAGFLLPGLYSEEVGTIVVANDESGSVDIAITEAFAAEILAIQQDMRPEKLVLMHFDTEVQKTEEFSPDDPFKMKRFCYGGTDFRPIFDAVDAMPTPPLCVVVLTDLYGPFPDTPPDYPVLWVSINKQVAPFGATIPIEV